MGLFAHHLKEARSLSKEIVLTAHLGERLILKFGHEGILSIHSPYSQTEVIFAPNAEWLTN